MKRKLLMALSLAVTAPLLMANDSGCSDADVASHNLSEAAEQFEVPRRVTLYNVIQDEAIASVEGYCSVEFYSSYSETTCMNDEGLAIKHMMEKSDNTTMIVEQVAPVGVSTYQYRLLVKPSVIIPDIDIVAPGFEGNSNHTTD